MNNNTEVSGRKCDKCPSTDGYLLTNGDVIVATLCESCYEAR